MNGRRILFSAIVTAVLGAVLGVVLVEIRPSHYADRAVHSSHLREAIVGAVVGLLAGAAQESVRELKHQQDRAEKLQDYLHTYLRLRDIDKKFEE